jgi:fatty acid synthase subunit alpha
LLTIDIRDKFMGPETTTEAEAVETFCAVVRNQSESFKAMRRSDVTAPMDFAIVTGWQVSHLICSLFCNPL